MKNIFYLLGAVLFLASCGSTPEAGFEFETSGEVAPVSVTFTNLSKDAKTYLWEFGDGETSTEENPVHEYRYWGSMTVTLTAINGDKTENIQQVINVKEPARRVAEIVTDYGSMRVQLSNFTPQHRDNFVKLAKEGFYNGLLFHRVMEGFMIQAGDPDSRNAPPQQGLGNGGPGYTVPAEFVSGLYHYKGALSAARQPDGVNPQKASSGSQFFIVQGTPTNQMTLGQTEQRKNFKYTAAEVQKYQEVGGAAFLDWDYTVFGYVLEGQEVIDLIASQPISNTNPNRPIKDIKILAVNMVDEIKE